VETVRTELYSGTMAFDPKTRKFFLPTGRIRVILNTNTNSSDVFKLERIPDSFGVAKDVLGETRDQKSRDRH